MGRSSAEKKSGARTGRSVRALGEAAALPVHVVDARERRDWRRARPVHSNELLAGRRTPSW